MDCGDGLQGVNLRVPLCEVLPVVTIEQGLRISTIRAHNTFKMISILLDTPRIDNRADLLKNLPTQPTTLLALPKAFVNVHICSQEHYYAWLIVNHGSRFRGPRLEFALISRYCLKFLVMKSLILLLGRFAGRFRLGYRRGQTDFSPSR